MNIGIDIDDTITKTYETLIPMVAISYGMNIDKLFEKVPTYKVRSYRQIMNLQNPGKILKLMESIVENLIF